MFENPVLVGGGFGNSFPSVGGFFTRASAFVRHNQRKILDSGWSTGKMEKQSKISLNLILAGLFGWLLLANGCGKPAGSDEIITKGASLADKAVGEPCENCVSPGSRSALLLAAAKNKQSNADPANIADPIVEQVIRSHFNLNKRTGGLTKADLESVTNLFMVGTQTSDAGLKELVKLKNLTELDLRGTQITDAGLKEVAKLENLTVLDLTETEITDAGAAELEKALPKCKIYHDAKK